jgi:putative Mg2+ transporter-C (MgtC) family protein
MAIIDIIGRLVLAGLCSAAVGFEREASNKAAGLRTHTLVGVGAASFSIVSIIGFDGPDESRLAAQIVTGVGFLGAGAIFRSGMAVQGLTTAAGIWAVAAVGVAAGSGSYALAVITTIVILVVMYSLRAADAALARRTRVARPQLEITLSDPQRLPAIMKFCRKVDERTEQIEFKRIDGGRGLLTVAVDPDHVDMMSEMVAAHRDVEHTEKLSPLYWKRQKPIG